MFFPKAKMASAKMVHQKGKNLRSRGEGMGRDRDKRDGGGDREGERESHRLFQSTVACYKYFLMNVQGTA